MRKITSLTAGLAFVLMVLTSVILYIVPQGRVAYWADWRLWGLSKTEWGNIHINLGLLFLIALMLHIYYNWKPMMSYLKNRARKMKVFTADFNMALAVTLVFALGTYFLMPPFSWVITLGDRIKDHGAERYGEPPYGHAELSSLKTFTRKMELDLEESLRRLNKSGFTAENGDVTLADLARRYNVPPQQLYQAIKGAAVIKEKASIGMAGAIPDSAPPGTGNLTLADLCASYNLNIKLMLRELKKRQINASEELTLRKIATQKGISPSDLYEIIKEVAKQKG